MDRSKTLEILNEKLCDKHISTRRQGNIDLSYIESHHAIREANRAFGFDQWSYEVKSLQEYGMGEENQKGNKVVSYHAIIQIKAIDVVREDVGFGQGINKDPGKAMEGAIKEAVSDGMKRCLRTFGDIFGLALYDKYQPNVVDFNAKDTILLKGSIEKCNKKEQLKELWKTSSTDIRNELKSLFEEKGRNLSDGDEQSSEA